MIKINKVISMKDVEKPPVITLCKIIEKMFNNNGLLIETQGCGTIAKPKNKIEILR